MTRGDNREASGRTAQSAHAPLWHGRPPLPPPEWRAAAAADTHRIKNKKTTDAHDTQTHKS